MSLKAPFVCEGEHLVVHTGGIADAEDVYATVDKLLRYPVHSHIALCTYKHLTLTSQGLEDGFHERSGLTGSRRTMHHGYVLCPQHLIDGFLLRGIKPRESHGVEGVAGGWCLGIEDVTKVGKSAAACSDNTVEGFKHKTIAGLVEEELYAESILTLQVHNASAVGQRHHHTVLLGIADSSGEGKILELAASLRSLRPCRSHVVLNGEEAHGATCFEIVLYVRTGLAHHLHHHLVERIIIASAYAYRKPSIATAHLALHAHCLRLLAKFLLLMIVFNLEKHALALK